MILLFLPPDSDLDLSVIQLLTTVVNAVNLISVKRIDDVDDFYFHYYCCCYQHPYNFS